MLSEGLEGVMYKSMNSCYFLIISYKHWFLLKGPFPSFKNKSPKKTQKRPTRLERKGQNQKKGTKKGLEVSFLIKEQFIVTTIESEATSEYLGKNLEITVLNHP